MHRGALGLKEYEVLVRRWAGPEAVSVIREAQAPSAYTQEGLRLAEEEAQAALAAEQTSHNKTIESALRQFICDPSYSQMSIIPKSLKCVIPTSTQNSPLPHCLPLLISIFGMDQLIDC